MIGQRFETLYCGPIEVVGYKNNTNVFVKFIKTGHITKTHKSTLISSAKPKLIDPLAPSVFGMGVIGIGPYKAHEKTKDTKAFSIWRAMLRRCYYRGAKHHQRSYDGITVCNEWLNFQSFAEWFHSHYPGEGYQIDKDKKIKGNTVYSPEACCFLTQRENLSVRRMSNVGKSKRVL